MPDKNPITRHEVLTVTSAEKNDYGDLMVNEAYKVGVKRSHLFEIFQIGADVKVGYAVYKDREYIATAEQTGKHQAPPQAPQSKSTPPKEENGLVEQAKKLGGVRVDDQKSRSMAVAYAKDLVCADKIELKELTTYADKFLQYMVK